MDLLTQPKQPKCLTTVLLLVYLGLVSGVQVKSVE